MSAQTGERRARASEPVKIQLWEARAMITFPHHVSFSVVFFRFFGVGVCCVCSEREQACIQRPPLGGHTNANLARDMMAESGFSCTLTRGVWPTILQTPAVARAGGEPSGSLSAGALSLLPLPKHKKSARHLLPNTCIPAGLTTLCSLVSCAKGISKPKGPVAARSLALPLRSCTMRCP